MERGFCLTDVDRDAVFSIVTASLTAKLMLLLTSLCGMKGKLEVVENVDL